MPKNKKSKSKTDVLRRILDNPNDPEIKKSISKDDKNMESIRKRLSGEPTTSDRTERLSNHFVSDSDRLEPRVTIHKKEKTPRPEITESKTIQEVEKEKKEPIKEDIIENDDLFEVEKIESSEPEFIQVSPKKIIKKEEKIIKKSEEISTIKEPNEQEIVEDSHEDLPEWEPAEEPKFIPIIKTVEEKEEISENKIDEDKEAKVEEKIEELPVFEEEEIEEEKEDTLSKEDEEEKMQTWEPIETRSGLSDDKEEMKIKKFSKPPVSNKIRQKRKTETHIRMHHPLVIFEMWAFTIIIGGFTVSGLFLLRDWIFSTFGVYGSVFIPTPNGTQNIHIWFGFAFAILGVIHVVIHIFSHKKDILPVQTSRDFKAFLHSGLYLIGFARREEYGTSGKYSGSQRIIYLCLVYILGLALVTGVLYYFGLISHGLSMVHVIPAGLGFMVLLFHFLITIRKHDSIALKGAFFTGKVPSWYVRKNKPIWYEELQPKKGVASPSFTQLREHKSFEGSNKLTNAIFTFASLFDESPDETIVVPFAEELQSTIDINDQERIIELAEQLDSVEEEIDETGESTEESGEVSSEKEEKGEVKDTELPVQEPADKKTISTEEKADHVKEEALDLKEEEPAKQQTEESPSITKEITDKVESKELETKEEVKEEPPKPEKEKPSEKKKDDEK